MRRFSIFLLSVTIAGIIATGCGNANPSTTSSAKDTISAFDLTAVRKIVETKNAEFAKAFTTGDSAGMVDYYTKDGKLFPPNSDAVIGRPAIGAVVAQYLKFGIKEFRDETTSLYGNEDNLIEEGNYFMGDGKGHTIDKGKYITIWRKVDGDWKVFSDMFNTSLPAASAK